jgi:hypothetical protein
MTIWAFASTFDASRRTKLEAFGTFDQVVPFISDNCQILNTRICKAKELGIECRRPQVTLNVGNEAFDVFFNSPGGYRAQYLESPEQGQAANGRLLGALEPRLTAAVLEKCGEDRLPQHWIRASFLANSAKIWPDEEQLDFPQATKDLNIPQWRKVSDTVTPAHAGLWAPEGTRLVVFGAFIDNNGNEIVSRKKIFRRFDIHECGFS